jgi:hypothetical protein
MSRLRTFAALLLATLATTLATAGPAGASVFPVEGPWTGKTTDGLAVSFEVSAGNVLNAHFGFKWGFCGAYESANANTDPIDAEGHWSYLDTRGQTIAGAFVAPDRVEGTVDAVERMLPGCPHTHATFVAIPGPTPPVLPPQVYAVRNASTGKLGRHPREIDLVKANHLSLYGLDWQDFGAPTTRASGTGEIRLGKRSWTPRATVTLSALKSRGPEVIVYSVLRWVLHGPVPAGFPRRGSKTFG